MAVVRMSLTLPPDIAEYVRREAEMADTSVSSWIEQAIRRALRIQMGLAGVDAFEREHGRPTPEVVDEVNRLFEQYFGPR